MQVWSWAGVGLVWGGWGRGRKRRGGGMAERGRMGRRMRFFFFGAGDGIRDDERWVGVSAEVG